MDYCRIPRSWSNALSIKEKCVGPRHRGQPQAKRIGSGFSGPAMLCNRLEFIRSDPAQASLNGDPTHWCKRNMIDGPGHQFLRAAYEHATFGRIGNHEKSV